MRMLFASTSDPNIRVIDGKLVTEDYVRVTLDLVVKDLLSMYEQYKHEYGEMVILLDDHSKKYWRKDFYPLYKQNRVKGREESNIDFNEFFKYSNELIDLLTHHLPWRTFHVKGAEADDTILVLSKEFSEREKVFIYSADKDMIQAQRHNDNVVQYSALTKKWLIPENKHDHMDEWIQEHVILGDAGDGVPKIVQHADFSENFKNHLSSFGLPEIFHNVKEFKYGFQDGDLITELDADTKKQILSTYDTWNVNKKGEKTELDVYVNPRFGPSNMKKAIEKHGSLDAWLDSHPLYREHYHRNFTLVMEEGIPDDIRTATFEEFNKAKKDFNVNEVSDWCTKHGLTVLREELIQSLSKTQEISAENCGW